MAITVGLHGLMFSYANPNIYSIPYNLKSSLVAKYERLLYTYRLNSVAFSCGTPPPAISGGNRAIGPGALDVGLWQRTLLWSATHGALRGRQLRNEGGKNGEAPNLEAPNPVSILIFSGELWTIVINYNHWWVLICVNYGIPNFDFHPFWDKPCNDEVLEWFFGIPGVETTNWIRFLQQHVVDAAFHSKRDGTLTRGNNPCTGLFHHEPSWAIIPSFDVSTMGCWWI